MYNNYLYEFGYVIILIILYLYFQYVNLKLQWCRYDVIIIDAWPWFKNPMNNQHRHNVFIFKGKLFAQVINLSVKRDNLVNMYVVEFSDHEDINVFSWLFHTQ